MANAITRECRRVWREIVDDSNVAAGVEIDKELTLARTKLFRRASAFLFGVLLLRVFFTFDPGASMFFSGAALLNFGVYCALLAPAWRWARLGRPEWATGLLCGGFVFYHGFFLGPRVGGLFATSLLSMQLVLVAGSALMGGRRVAMFVLGCALSACLYMLMWPGAASTTLAYQVDTAMHRFSLHFFFLSSVAAIGWFYAGDLRSLVSRASVIRDGFKGVFTTSPVALVITRWDPASLDVEVRAVNPAAQALLQTSEASCLGVSILRIPSGVKLSGDQMREVAKACEEGLSLDLGFCDLSTSDRSRARVIASLRPAAWMGEPCMLWTLEDVTPMVAAREAAERANEALAKVNGELERRVRERGDALSAMRVEMARSESLASLGATVAGVAHELNTPLGNALLAASALRGDFESLEKKIVGATVKRSDLTDFCARGRLGAALIETSLSRSAEIVGRLKRTSSDRSSMHRRSFELGSCVADSLALLRPSIERDPRPLDVEFVSGAQIEVDSYPGAVGQIVSNLVNNAILHAFGEAGGSVRVWIEERGGRAAVVVEDDGAGVPAELAARIFDMHFTTKLGQGGTGLGLSISAELAREILGGELRLVSRPDGAPGARFEALVARAAPSDKAKGQAEARRAHGAEGVVGPLARR